MAQNHETDYLIVGAGAVGLAFADTLLDESDAHVTLVDRHAKPGGHWNDAYSFVSLHQPSAFYGVNSMALGDNRKDSMGTNAGFYELASGAEVSAYFDKVMQQRLLPSGRVHFFPMSDYRGNGTLVSLLSGQETQLKIRRKTVDATFIGTAVPSTHTPKYQIAAGVRVIAPNDLPQLWQGRHQRPLNYVIVGAGKTAMDAGVWLLNSGAAPQSIYWVMPRDSWLLNRRHVQPGPEFFNESIGGQLTQMKALAEAKSLDDLFAKLEATGIMLRIDPGVKPEMFHYATISVGEVEQLRKITQVIRQGRVQAIDAEGLMLERGRVAMPAGTLYIDCTASAVEKRKNVPMFQGEVIIPQLTRVPQPTFSAAMVAYVEAHYDDDARKNQICTPVPFPDSLKQYPGATLGNMMNQFQWSQDKVLRKWILESRLDGFGKVIASVAPDDAAKQAILLELRNYAMRAAANIPKILS
jgi:hypothetical protein